MVGETKSSEKLEAMATNQIWWLFQPQCWFSTASKFMQNISLAIWGRILKLEFFEKIGRQ